jgi:hypothetical protein
MNYWTITIGKDKLQCLLDRVFMKVDGRVSFYWVSLPFIMASFVMSKNFAFLFFSSFIISFFYSTCA